MCRRRRGHGCRMPDWLRDYEARTCSILAIISFSCAVTSFAVFTDSAVLSLTVALKPAVCRIESSEELYGLTKCHWTSCRGSCTALFYNCTQIKVGYVLSENRTSNVTDSDTFDTNGSVLLSNTTDTQYNKSGLSAYILNKTLENKIVENDRFIAELFEGLGNAKKNDTTEESLQSDMNTSSKQERILSSLNISVKIVLPDGSVNANISSNAFVANHSSDAVPTSVDTIESANLESETYINELFKDYEGGDLMSLNSSISENFSSVVPLYVNIFGCGYEPEELCEQFFANYTHVGLEFQCLISFQDEIFAVPNPDDYDFTKFKDPMRSLLLSLIPLGICVVSSLYIRVRRLYRMKPKDVEDPKPKRRPLMKKDPQDGKESKTPTNLESRCSTKMSVRKNGQDHVPAFIKVQMPPTRVAEPAQNIDRENFL